MVPGSADRSELIERIDSADPEAVMPPPATQSTLSASEKALLKRWIDEGAEYEVHWAFVPPRAAPPPPVRRGGWCRNPIDRFVMARLEAEGMKPLPEADRATLIRRVSLDLTGLPPSWDAVVAFVRDDSPDAYEHLVDRLLASPRYGERWARRWLDLARYADTNGYEKDRPRSIWPWRDWVVGALNADMPFDQFTIEQLAGDLLPGATESQRVATGFHRNTMINEEGGIDPLEYRYYSVVDRVATTGTTWLGLTVGCAQCHTHKYDPITQREYFQFLALQDNTEEPELQLERGEITRRRSELEAEVAARRAALTNEWPLDTHRWSAAGARLRTDFPATVEALPDGSFRLGGTTPDRGRYTVLLESDLAVVGAIRLEALPDPSLPKAGPGRAENGNFVLSEVRASVLPGPELEQIAAPPALEPGADVPANVSPPGGAAGSVGGEAHGKREGSGVPLRFARAEADASQKDFDAAKAIDGDTKTGWAVQVEGDWHVRRVLTLVLESPVRLEAGRRVEVVLDQEHGGRHLLGRLRLSLGEPVQDPRPAAERRAEAVAAAWQSWLEHQRARTVVWEPVLELGGEANLSWLTPQPDGSLLAEGDMTKSDTYVVRGQAELRGVRGIRLEAMPDDRLPNRGPGRTFYEGPKGDFFLSEFAASVDGVDLTFRGASESYARPEGEDRMGAAKALDRDPQTGWSIAGRVGEPHQAVFQLAEPLPGGKTLEVRMLFERYHAAGLGRFRLAVTREARPAVAGELPTALESALRLGEAEWTAEQRTAMWRQFLEQAPELAEARRPLAALRATLPEVPTTLVMAERPSGRARSTPMRRRGEFLQPGEVVEPGVLGCLPPLEARGRADRLALARWLVAPGHPLTARVTVNRQWAALFGTGLVRTTEDFGVQGSAPTHPELLDWLALEFVRGGWSMKRLHRLMVTSATYRQASRVTADRLARDPENRWLSRAPRLRMEAEMVRDSALKAAGLLSGKRGGPGVFPPQPAGVTTEGTYGPLEWKISEGEDRYRRSLYTFAKRTAPYAMAVTFDAPSGEACLARRDVSNTPLQALTLLNDTVFVEAAQALGRSWATLAGADRDRAERLWGEVLSRKPTRAELRRLLDFVEDTRRRFLSDPAAAAAFSGRAPDDPEAVECAVWAAAARALLNLDEFITRS